MLAAVAIAVGSGLLYHPGQLATAEVAPEAYWSVAGRSISKMDTLYLSTITRATGLLVGGAFAMLWRPVAVMRGPLRQRGRELDRVAIVGLTGLGALAWVLHVQTQSHAHPWLRRSKFERGLIREPSPVVSIAHLRRRRAVKTPGGSIRSCSSARLDDDTWLPPDP